MKTNSSYKLASKSAIIAAGKMVRIGSNTSIPPEPPATQEFDTIDFDDTDFETGKQLKKL